MSEKKKKERDELLETGRTYGNIARTEPDVWAWVEKEESLTGRKKHDIIGEAIARYIIEREVIQKGLTMEQMLAAWDIKDRIEAMLWKKAMTLGTGMFGSLLTQVGELVAGIRQVQEEKIAEIVEAEKKRDIEYEYRKTQAKMASALMEAMMPVLMATLSQIKIPGQQAAPVQPQKQEEKKAGIDVEVIE